MIHGVSLAPTIKEHLTEIVQLQMELLYCAATLDTFNKDTCADYLNNRPRDPRFKGRGTKITRWLWKPRTSTRHIHLENFATKYASKGVKNQREERERKKQWCLRLEREVKMLSDRSIPYIEIADFFGDERKPDYQKKIAYSWKGEAALFLLYFYENFDFSEDLFADAKPFGRQDFLKAFLDANADLEICPICDESRYYTRGKGLIHTDIDHYLPKSLYPHFACHPFNLIPICHPCNSTVKERKDPLVNSGHRRPLTRYALPYRDNNWSMNGYLEVKLGKEISFVALRPRKDAAGGINTQQQEALQLLSEIYDIPHHWDANKIAETLFRRMRQFFGDGKGMPLGNDMLQEVYNTLKQLLYYLDKEDRQKDPFAFAMVWTLATIIEETLKPLTVASSNNAIPQSIEEDKQFARALIQEIVSWFGQNLDENELRDKYVEDLLAILRK